MTIAEALARAERELAAAGVPSPDWDAELLLRHVLGWSRAEVVVRSGGLLPPDRAAAFEALVAQRARRHPLQHLTGVQAFWRDEFVVTPDVLVPRPETELAVEESVRVLAGLTAPVVVDVGTGSGCIALSIARERPDADVHAVDLSHAALTVARENAHRLQRRITFHEGDLLGPVAGLRIDLVVSNPPYVEDAEWTQLQPEVRDHDPRTALVPPEGPLPLYRRLIAQAAALAVPRLVLEVGTGQADAVMIACSKAGYGPVAVRNDLAGIPRTVVASR